MSAFQDGLEVEAEGRRILEPFLEQRAYKGRIVWTTKGALAKELQKTVGDVLYNSDPDTVVAADLKVEKDWTGNVFLERWSNRSRWTAGWFETLQTDLLLDYFISCDTLLAFHFARLRAWMYECDTGKVPRANSYQQRVQRKRNQLNDTWGMIVPVKDIPLPDVLLGKFQPQLMFRNLDVPGIEPARLPGHRPQAPSRTAAPIQGAGTVEPRRRGYTKEERQEIDRYLRGGGSRH